MEAKALIMCLLILGLVVSDVEGKTCCKNNAARRCLSNCVYAGGSRPICATGCECVIVTSACPPGYPRGMLENSAIVGEYCKLGCMSSLCDVITSGLNSGVADGKVKEAAEQCRNECSELCNNSDKFELPAFAA